MANLKNVIYLSNEDYETLVTTGSVTIDGTTLAYDEDNVYITPETTATTSSDGLMSASDKSKLDSIDSGAEANTVTDIRINGTSILSNKIANIVTNTAYSSTNNKIATMSDLPTDYIVSGSANYLKSASASGNTLTLAYGNNSTVTYSPTIENTDTWRPIQVAGTQKLGSATTTGALNFLSSGNVKFTYNSGLIANVDLSPYWVNNSNTLVLKAGGATTIRNSNSTGDYTLSVPEQSGTIAVTSDIPKNCITYNDEEEGTENNLPKYDSTGTKLVDSGVTVNASGDLVTNRAIYLTNISGSISSSVSRLYFGSTSSPYSWLTSNQVGAFSLATANGAFTFYANTSSYNCFMTNVGSNLGRNDSNGSYAWGSLYTKGNIYKYSGSSSTGFYTQTLPAKSGTFAMTSDIPTKTSQLTNDSNFATTSQIPTATSDLTNDSGFITSADIPTKTSELTNDSGFITSSDLPTNHVTTNTAQDITGQKTIIGQTRIKGSAAAGSADNTTNGFQFWKYGTTSYNKTSTDYLGLISPNDSGALGFYGRTALYFRPVITNGTVNTSYGVTMDSTGLFPGSTIMPLGKSSNPWGHIYSQNQTISGYLTDGSHYWNLPASGGTSSAPSKLVDTNDSRLSDSRTPTAHASTATTYGIGTASNYGHVKLTSGDLNGVAASDGIAANVGHTHSQYAQASNVYSKSEIDTQIQNVTEIAEGKTKTYAINDTTTGTNIINSQFNSTNDDIAIGNSGTNKIKDTQGNEILLSDLNVGDIILITQVDVPDRWVSTVGSGSGSTVFSKLESTKSDISNMVSASSTLTSNQIIIGGGNKSVSASGKTISTSVANNDTTVPTGKAVQTYVTGLGYLTTVTPNNETITVIDSSAANPIATTTINGIASAGSTPTLGHTEYTWSAGSVPTRAQFTYANGGFTSGHDGSLTTSDITVTSGTTPTLTGTYTASSKNFAISFNKGSATSLSANSFKAVSSYNTPQLATSTAYQITGVGSVPSLKNGTTEATTVSNISSWNAGTIPTIASSTTVVTSVATTTKSVVTGVASS